jgi:hypothetical protein
VRTTTVVEVENDVKVDVVVDAEIGAGSDLALSSVFVSTEVSAGDATLSGETTTSILFFNSSTTFFTS